MRFSLILATTLALAACGKDSDSEPSQPSARTTNTTTVAKPAGDPAAKAKEIFATRCTPCHGAGGAGDGAASAALDPKPRNFTDPAWQGSVDDAHIEKIIKFGGAAVGKSAAMPSNPDLNDEAVIVELRKFVRGLGTK